MLLVIIQYYYIWHPIKEITNDEMVLPIIQLHRRARGPLYFWNSRTVGQMLWVLKVRGVKASDWLAARDLCATHRHRHYLAALQYTSPYRSLGRIFEQDGGESFYGRYVYNLARMNSCPRCRISFPLPSACVIIKCFMSFWTQLPYRFNGIYDYSYTLYVQIQHHVCYLC
jgi:hypothetical protein